MHLSKNNFYMIFLTCIFIIITTQNFASAQNKSKDLIQAEKLMDELNNAEPTKKGQTQREAVLEASRLEAEKMMTKSNTNDEKFDTAINIFRGFYLINAVSRPKYCQKNDVNINKFTELFKNKYKNEFTVMSEYEKKHKHSEKTTKELLQLLDKQVATEIEMTVNQYNLTSKVFCKDFQNNAKLYVEQIDLKNRFPEAFYLLNK